jgi:hypothetical protein
MELPRGSESTANHGMKDTLIWIDSNKVESYHICGHISLQ